MTKNTFSKTTKVKEITLNDFILGDEKESVRSTFIKDENTQWDNARNDVHKFINVRMPEEYFMKLDYVSKKHRISKNKICLEAVIAEIDRMLTL